MRHLHLAPELKLPPELVTETVAILGRRGSGKTHTGSVIAEELLKAGLHTVIIDPLDVWWGLRSSADGAAAGLPIAVFGGHHADLPLEADAGELLADLVVDEGLSVVLSVRHLSKNDQRKFVAAFGERLYHRKGEQDHRDPLHLILDEADVFVPQRLFPGVERAFGAIDTLVRRGRSSGVGTTLISQRAAVINKDVLTQTEALIAHQTTSPQDRKALEAWIEANDTEGHKAQFLGSLASLRTGTAWFWSPGWRKVFKLVHIRPRDTFDSSSTPRANAKQIIPKTLAQVDIDALRGRLEAIVERSEAEDPSRLRQRIQELEEQLAEARTAAAVDPPAPQVVYIPALTPEDLEVTAGTAAWLRKAAEQMEQTAAGILERVDRARERAKAAGDQTDLANHPVAEMVVAEASAGGLATRAVRPVPAGNGSISAPQQRILNALAWLAAAGITQPLRVQAAFLAEISPRSSGFRNNLSALKTAGLLEYRGSGSLALTSRGAASAVQLKAKITSAQFQNLVLEQLPNPQAKILRVLIGSYPRELTRDHVARQADQSPASSGYRNNLSALRTLNLIAYRPQSRLVAQPILFLESR